MDYSRWSLVRGIKLAKSIKQEVFVFIVQADAAALQLC